DQGNLYRQSRMHPARSPGHGTGKAASARENRACPHVSGQEEVAVKRLLGICVAAVAIAVPALISSSAALAATQSGPSAAQARGHAGKPVEVHMQVKITGAEVLA